MIESLLCNIGATTLSAIAWSDITAILTAWGLPGMFVAAFLAASVLPFSSEAVMVGLAAAGLDPWLLVAFGTAGNVGGSMFNYTIGRMGKMEWIEKYLHVKHDDMERAQRFMAGRGALMGFFSFIPVVGDGITVALGLMRANLMVCLISITAGKLLRYIILIYAVGMF